MSAWSLKPLLQALGWPASEQPLIQHSPMWDDEDVAWIEDYLYVNDLADDMEDAIAEHGHLYFPYGPTVEELLKRSLSPAAHRAVYNPWPTFQELWSEA